MAIQAKKQSPWLAVALIIAAVAVWFFEQKNSATDSKNPRSERSAPAGSKPPVSPGKNERQGNYEVYRNCELATDKNNDGDSFRVRLPDGRQEIFRLYFVDTPESAFKSYRGGDTNHQRINEQAQYFRTSPEQAVEIGKQGKHFTLDLLAGQPFTIFTNWDSPFNDQRYHAFIEVNSGGKKRWLHELLIEKGLARLKTKPADLPDGTKAADHRRKLDSLKLTAEKNRAGAWAR